MKAEIRYERSLSASSDDEDEIPDAEPDEGAPPPAATQYEILRDNGFRHLRNADLDDQRATQVFLRRRGQIGDNHAADNAIIEQVTCVNFMCHERLHVELGPLINFVVGMNGSGKSAVLTAITLCLGGKASATNRGASLKSLIKQGTDQAILTVKLKNEGPDAFQSDLYGDSIIVERHFSKTGSSGYRLKTAMGRTVSTKKGDVDDIIEYFQLQVDNPMNVLTQDAAKSFIQNSTPAQKYKFFVEGVQLQQLDNDYRLVSDTCDAIESKLDEAKGDIRILKKKYDAATEKASIVERHKDMREAASRCREQLVWAQIEVQEANLAHKEEKIVAARESIGRAESMAEDKDKALQRADEVMENAQASVHKLEEELTQVRTEEEAAKNAHDEATKNVQAAHTEQRQIKQSITAAKKKVEGYITDIHTEKQRLEDANGGAHSRKVAEIKAAQQAAKDAKDALEQSETEGPRLSEAHTKAQDELIKAEAPLAAKRKEIDDCRKRLHALTTDRGDVMQGFGPNMPRLLQMIRNEGGFREKPIGPIGLHVKLLKPIWSNTIESVIGRNLSGFIVTNKADQMKLSSMLRQVGMEWCPVLIGNHHSFDTSGYEPDSQYETILRVLDIDNDLVRRQLIINHGIEQSLLVKRRTDASNIMYHSGSKPNNVRVCYCLHDSRRDFGHRLAYSGSSNNEDMSPVRYQPQQKPRMRTDIEIQISLQKETLNQLEQEKTLLENRCTQLRQDVNKCQTAMSQQRRKHEQLKLASQRAEDRIETLQSELDRDNVEDGRLDALQGYLEEAQTEQKMYEENFVDSVNEKDKLNEISTTKKRKLDDVKTRIADHEARLRKAELKLRNTKQARLIVLTEKNAAFDRIGELQVEMAAAEKKRDEQAALVADHTRQAAEICQRVPVDEGETPASLETKYNKLRQQIKTYNQRLGGSDEEIMRAREEALTTYKRASTCYDEMQELLLLLKQSFMKRLEQYQRFQRYISCRSRINFNYLLSERAFRGKLSIDHEKKLLDVHVEPDETTKSSKGRQTKTLSGGEKSFSSICLLLALWEAMGAPLRCLDEYDVFMDDVNRDVSTKMIVSSDPLHFEWRIHTNRE